MKQLLAVVFFFTFFLSIFVFSPSAFSQTFQGTLRGRVTDPGGAATANVKVTLTDEATSVNRSTITK